MNEQIPVKSGTILVGLLTGITHEIVEHGWFVFADGIQKTDLYAILGWGLAGASAYLLGLYQEKPTKN